MLAPWILASTEHVKLLDGVFGGSLGVTWTATSATIEVTTEDGRIPPLEPLQSDLEAAIPGFIDVDVVVSPAVEHDVLPR